jgi:hypothetical protein
MRVRWPSLLAKMKIRTAPLNPRVRSVASSGGAVVAATLREGGWLIETKDLS